MSNIQDSQTQKKLEVKLNEEGKITFCLRNLAVKTLSDISVELVDLIFYHYLILI